MKVRESLTKLVLMGSIVLASTTCGPKQGLFYRDVDIGGSPR